MLSHAMATRGSMPTQLGPGAIVAGKYRVLGLLGRGGFGYVVAAEHLELRERRAIKCLLPEASSDAEALERFLREARIAAGLRTEHVVAVHDAGRLDGGEPYIVMEHLEGEDLGATLQARGPLEVAEAVGYVSQVLDALELAHAAGVVHRDLKPTNLFLTRDARGRPLIKLLDFGISKITGNPTLQTRADAVFGTPEYMSPEQLRATATADPRSDIWAVGVILYELLTGEQPFSARSVGELCLSVLNDQPAPASSRRAGLPQALDAVVARCLEKDPARRYGSARELADALGPFVGRADRVVPAPLGVTPPAPATTHEVHRLATADTAAALEVPADRTASASPRSIPATASARGVPVAAPVPAPTYRARTAAILGAVVAALGAGVVVLVVALGAKNTPPAAATSTATASVAVAGSTAPSSSAAAVASPASSAPLPRLLPIDYPRVPTTAVAGQKAFGLNRQQLERSLAESAAGKHYVAAPFVPVTVLEPGPEQSLVQKGGDKYLLPNAVIVPIRRGERAAVGDIIVAGWVWTVGIVVGGSATAPVFRTLDGAMSPTGDTLYSTDETGEPDTFMKLRGVVEPGQPVAARDGAGYKLVRVIHARNDIVLTTELTGALSVYPRTDLVPMPLDPRVMPGDSAWVPSVAGFAQAKVVSVDARLGRVWAERSGEKLGYGFTNVIASLSGP